MDLGLARSKSLTLLVLCGVFASACQDGGAPDNPFSQEIFPAKGQFIELSPPIGEILTKGEKLKLTVSVRDAYGKQIQNPQVKWESLYPGVATVDGTGTVTGLNEGVTEIRGTHGTVMGIAVIAVAKPGLRNGTVTVDPKQAAVPSVGAQIKLVAVGRNNGGQLLSNTSFNWSSVDPAVAVVDGSGLVTGRGSGQTQIVVRNGSVADTALVIVAPPGVAVGVRITPKTATIQAVGQTVRLSATVVDGVGNPMEGAITWASLDPSIAAVSGDGTVVGGARGVARIRASHGSFADTAQVSVAPSGTPASIIVRPKVDTIAQVGGTRQLTVTVLDGSGKELTGHTPTWGTMDAAVVTVNQAGLVTGVSKGTARVTARLNSLVDTATISVAPGPTGPFRVVVTPKLDTIPSVGQTKMLTATIYDSKGQLVDAAMASWSSLNPSVASVSSAGPSKTVTVSGQSSGLGMIRATYDTGADTAAIHVAPGSGSGRNRIVITPSPDSVDVGARRTLSASFFLADGTRVDTATAEWGPLDWNIVKLVGPQDRKTMDIEGVSSGVTKVVAYWKGAFDSATIVVRGSGNGNPGSPTITVTPSTDTIPSVGGTKQLTATVRDAQGNVMPGATVVWASLDPSIATVGATGLVNGRSSGLSRITASHNSATGTAYVWVAPPPPPPPGWNLTPPTLKPYLSVLTQRGNPPEPMATFDWRFTQYDKYTYDVWVQNINSPDQYTRENWLGFGNHSGALRGRLSWALRNGQPYGPGVTDVTRFAYARGRHMVKSWLEATKYAGYDPSSGLTRDQWAKDYGFLPPGHGSTGMADVAVYYMLEGDADARYAIHVAAGFATDNRWGEYQLTGQYGEPRIVAIALTAFRAATHIGIPYTNPQPNRIGLPAALGSWRAAGDRQVGWVAQALKPDGALYSPEHYANYNVPQEVFFMNAWVAEELLLWYGDFGNVQAFDTARRIIDHQIAELNRRGGSCLGYLSAGPSYEQVPAPDLSGYFIWPSLVLFQETGDFKYRDFALKNMTCSHTAGITGVKQFNQVYSYLSHGAEALLAGTRWR